MIILHPALRYFFAAVWLINGLYCKVLDQVPRHERIVAAILGEDHSALFTRLIGAGEIGMAVWILSRWKYSWCAVAQVVLIVVMNFIEFFTVPGLLLWGRFNIVFALGLVAVILMNTFARSTR